MRNVAQRAMSPRIEGSGKNAFVPLRVTEAIKRRIAAAAKRDGVTVSEWLRQAALEKLRRDEL